MTISLEIAGGCAVFGGIILGNVAIWRIVDAAEQLKKQDGDQMFSSMDALDPPSPSAQRTEAFRRYKQSQPNGPLIKRLRLGQALVVLGCLVMIVGAFI